MSSDAGGQRSAMQESASDEDQCDVASATRSVRDSLIGVGHAPPHDRVKPRIGGRPEFGSLDTDRAIRHLAGQFELFEYGKRARF